MFIRIAWCSAYISAVVFCVRLKLSQSHSCSIEKMENVTIDIKVALSKGIRGADPIHTASQEICADLCCSGEKITATKKCNYAVFETRRKGNYPNCYLFYYPAEETCPVRPVIGLLTYRIILGAENPQPRPSSNKVSTMTGSFISPPATAFDPPSPRGLSDQLHPLPISAASNRPEILDQIDGHSEKLKGRRVFESSTVTETSSSFSKSILKTTHHISATVQPTVKLSAIPSGIQTGTTVGTIPHVPCRSCATTRSSGGDYHSTLISQSPTEISSSSFHNSLSNNRQVGSEDNILDGFSSKKQIPHFHDASILIAALFFGVIFLILVTVLVGRKMLETLQQRRYTRLDYLINDMYVNM